MSFKTKKILGFAVAPMLALSACQVAPPSGPSITALPGPGKSFQQFQQDDYNCRSYAQSRTPYSQADAQNSTNNSIVTGAAGTLIGAAAGAALGAAAGNAGAGAAIGAGVGLAGGASVAGNQAQGAADSLQHRYDVAYAQCMVGNGETVQASRGYYAQPPGGGYYGPQPGYYAPPPPPPPGYYYRPY